MIQVLSKLKYRQLFLGMLMTAIITTIMINLLPIFKKDKTVITLSIVFYIYPCYWIIKNIYKSNNSIKEWLKPYRINWLDTLKAIIIPQVLGIGLLGIISTLLLHIISIDIETNSVQKFQQPTAISILIMVLIAPIAEEIIFRGFMLNRMLNNWTVKKAIIINSAIFGALHLHNGLSTIIVGLIFSILYLKYGSLWSTIIPHMINNLLVVIIKFWTASDKYVSSETNIDLNTNSILVAGIFLTTLGLLSMFFFIKSNKHILDDNKKIIDI